MPDLDGVATVALLIGVTWSALRLVMRVPLRRIVPEAFFAGYAVGLMYVVAFAYGGFPAPEQPWRMVNLVPLRTILQLATPDHLTQAFRQLVGNVVLFVPFGLLLPVLSPRFRKTRSLILAALVGSASIEFLQFVLLISGTGSRSVDIDDVVLNTLGAVVGYVLWVGAESVRQKVASTPSSEIVNES